MLLPAPIFLGAVVVASDEVRTASSIWFAVIFLGHLDLVVCLLRCRRRYGFVPAAAAAWFPMAAATRFSMAATTRTALAVSGRSRAWSAPAPGLRHLGDELQLHGLYRAGDVLAFISVLRHGRLLPLCGFLLPACLPAGCRFLLPSYLHAPVLCCWPLHGTVLC